MIKKSNFIKNLFYSFILLYLCIGIYLSLNVGITHDESHSFLVWELNKKKLLNIFFNQNYDVSGLDSYSGFYGIGFYLFSVPIEYLIKIIFNINIIPESGKLLLIKHPAVFVFFIISGLYLEKIIFFITKNKNYSYLSTVFYLTYPYLLGHSFFNIKDIPFMSVWLVCTYYLIIVLNNFFTEHKVKKINLILLALLTAYLFSIRINGVLIFIQYLIFLIVYLNVFKFNFIKFIRSFYNFIILFSLVFLIFAYIFYPNFWNSPLKFIDSIKFASQIPQSVCTLTLGECMKGENLSS